MHKWTHTHILCYTWDVSSLESLLTHTPYHLRSHWYVCDGMYATMNRLMCICTPRFSHSFALSRTHTNTQQQQAAPLCRLESDLSHSNRLCIGMLCYYLPTQTNPLNACHFVQMFWHFKSIVVGQTASSTENCAKFRPCIVYIGVFIVHIQAYFR